MEKENSIGFGIQPLLQFADIGATPSFAEEKGVMLFGVRLNERSGGSMRKSMSLGNLGLYNLHHLYGHASPPEGSESGGAVADGYASDGLVQAASSSSRERKKGVPWTEDEHKMFLVGLQKLGKGDWRGISRNFVPTRTPTQVASHAQKYYLRQANLNKRKRRSSLFDIPADYTSSAPVPIPGADGGSQKLVPPIMSRSADSTMSCSPYLVSKHDITAAPNLSNATFSRPPICPLQNLSGDLYPSGAHNLASRTVTTDLGHQTDMDMKAMQAETGFLVNVPTSPSSLTPPPHGPLSCQRSSKVFRPTAMLPSMLARIDEAGEMPSHLSLTIGPPSSSLPTPPFGTEPNSLSLKLEQPLATRHSAFHSGGATITGGGMGSNGNAISVV